MERRKPLSAQAFDGAMVNGNPDDEDERALFRDSVRGTRPLRQDRRPPPRRRVKPVPRMSRADEAQVLEDMLTFDPGDAGIETGEELLFARPGLQHGLMRRLRRGQYVTRAELDLHGMTAAEARTALGEFLARCRSRDLRCVRIIHGKGLGSPGKKPVLKSRVNGWLQRSDAVLAFCSARPQDGGTGAVYVLLKKSG